ncbi:MAG: PolC-type DNA polymerase III [Gemmatimonadaceae bacterium]
MELHALPYVVVDVETTGGQPAMGDRVTEVAAVQVEQGRIARLYHSLVNPERPIPPYVARLTGISDAMVREAPTFAEIAGELAAHLAGRIFVAHNARFDLGFLGAEFARVAPTPLDELLGGSLCTVRLARRVLGHLPRRNLDAVCHHYGVRIADRHRAAGDAEATAQVLVHLMDDLSRHGIHTWDELERWLSRGTSRSKRARAIPVASDGADGA